MSDNKYTSILDDDAPQKDSPAWTDRISSSEKPIATKHHRSEKPGGWSR